MTCAHDSCLLASLRSLRNGIELGARIRAAHCLVMILLYKRNQSFLSNLQFLFKATREHSLNLGIFAFLYKSLKCLSINQLRLTEGESSFAAGLIGGYVVWGRDKTPINYQIVLYLLSRNITGLANRKVTDGTIPNIQAYPLFASLTWAVVMYLHSTTADSLQEGLKSSMDFLYSDDDHWKAKGYRQLSDFIPFTG